MPCRSPELKRVRASGTFTAARPRKNSQPLQHRQAKGKTNKSRSKKKQLEKEEAELAAVLEAHNRRFKPVPQYEPALHSFRDVKKVRAGVMRASYRLLCALTRGLPNRSGRQKQARSIVI